MGFADRIAELFGTGGLFRGFGDTVPARAFRGNFRLKRVRVPRRIRVIGGLAFSNCENLIFLTLPEGLEVLEDNAFCGCRSLRELVIPDSLRSLGAFCFLETDSLRSPVLSADGSALYHLPLQKDAETVILPEGVRRIRSFAINDCGARSITLPEGLEEIERCGLCSCGFTELIFPASVKRIRAEAVSSCMELRRVFISGADTVIEDGAFFACHRYSEYHEIRFERPGRPFTCEETLRFQGRSFLQPVGAGEPENDDFWKTEAFDALAAACEKGSGEAMLALSRYFLTLGTGDFYRLSASYWLRQAQLHGSGEAGAEITAFMETHPGEQLPAAAGDRLRGGWDGLSLRRLGYRFFDPERSYTLPAPDEDGLVLADSWVGTEDADSDGFGMEEDYDWWFLDEFLSPLPGISCIRGRSGREMHWSGSLYKESHAAALEALQRKRAAAAPSDPYGAGLPRSQALSSENG